MGIFLDIQGIECGKVFTPKEAVRGVVRLELDRPTAIFDVTLLLEGLVQTSLIEKGPAFILGNDVPKVADERHQLFKDSRVLFPRPNTPFIARGYTLPKGQYVFPFEVNFPLWADCPTSQHATRHQETALPPSFDAHAATNGAHAKVAYTLQAEVTRRSRLRKVISTQQNLNFVAFDPAAALLSSLGTGCCTGQKVLYTSSHNSPGCSLTQLPIMLLEAKLPSPPVLFLREKLPLQLCVRTLPTRIHHILPIKVQNLAISLRSMTSITADVHHTSWSSCRKLLDLHGLDEIINCDRERDVLSEIKPGVIRGVTIPQISPSFTTCTVEHKHSLEVDAAFSLSELPKLLLVKLVINVEMLSGNDLEGELYTEDGGADGNNIPLRRGCLAHLSVPNSVGREGYPPPY
ncbi:hypothetical protein BJY01DRAFT_252616 [Aspergillus pseudoustus]|uniref:Arrestin-like N-terminal domain-containing protein n=1 Tax=Aspergillus pseudoustus TaxID=1810923 RepID=A0ABR4J620_9EURO